MFLANGSSKTVTQAVTFHVTFGKMIMAKAMTNITFLHSFTATIQCAGLSATTRSSRDCSIEENHCSLGSSTHHKIEVNRDNDRLTPTPSSVSPKNSGSIPINFVLLEQIIIIGLITTTTGRIPIINHFIINAVLVPTLFSALSTNTTGRIPLGIIKHLFPPWPHPRP